MSFFAAIGNFFMPQAAIPPQAIPKGPEEFYEPQRPQVHALVAEATGLVNDVAAIVTNYAIHLDLFGAPEWKRYFNQDVGDQPPLPDVFWKFWQSPDPADPTKKVWETHLPPVLRPELVIDMDTKANRNFCLYVMGELTQKPKEGHASVYCIDSDALNYLGRIEAGPTYWLVMRKEVFSRNQTYAQQIQDVNNLKADYEAGPSAIDLVTVVFTRFVVTQECYLGDDTGIEARWTYSRCKEMVKYGEKVCPVVVGGYSFGVGDSRAGLSVLTNSLQGISNDYAIVALRKFSGKEI